jgi:hypothetical protein
MAQDMAELSAGHEEFSASNALPLYHARRPVGGSSILQEMLKWRASSRSGAFA